MWESISVVIPVYNSSRSLEELYEKLSIFLHKNFYDYEIIMVDDGSKDNSYEKMRELHERDIRVKIISLTHNFGQQNALMCGLHYARCKYILTMDDDLQHQPKEIKKLMHIIDKGYDVVYGISDNKHKQFYRNLGSKLTNHLFNLILDKDKEIRVSSFRILTREILQKVVSDKRSFVYISAIILKHTDNIANVEVRHNQRLHGESNYTYFKLLKLFSSLFIYYSDCPFIKLLRAKKPQYVIKDIQGINN